MKIDSSLLYNDVLKKFKRQLGALVLSGVAGAAFLCLFSSCRAAHAEVLYAVSGSRGSITFTSRTPSPDANYRIVRTVQPRRSRVLRTPGSFHGRMKASKSKYLDLISQTAREHEVEGALVKAVVHVESAFDPDATSYKGAMGLMQLMPGTASRFGVHDAYQPTENVAGGVRYLKSLLGRYNGDLRLALAAYNAGEGAVDQTKSIPPYSETQSYVRKVLSALEVYRCVDAGNTSCGG